MALVDFSNPTPAESLRLGNSDTLRHKIVSFPGDAAYATGGSAGFQTKVRKLLGHDVTVVGVVPIAAGGYIPEYDRANDKLLVRQCAGSGNPAAQVSNAADLSGTTFVLMVLYI